MEVLEPGSYNPIAEMSLIKTFKEMSGGSFSFFESISLLKSFSNSILLANLKDFSLEEETFLEGKIPLDRAEVLDLNFFV